MIITRYRLLHQKLATTSTGQLKPNHNFKLLNLKQYQIAYLDI